MASLKLAVLIDADNAQASIAPELLAEIARYGTATVKRAYGDWTTPNLTPWKQKLHAYAIQPMQQFSYTKGKNSTDSSLIIDAMDLLHSERIDGFCLVSSDSDFTRLATRIRESGLIVYGFGEHKTPEPFVKACDKFIYTEILREPEQELAKQQPEGPDLKSLLLPAVDAAIREDGWAPLSAVGALITKTTPSFDPRNYQFKKLGELVRAQKFLEVKDVPTSDGHSHVFVKAKSPVQKR